MNVLAGPRRELRRVIVAGRAVSCRLDEEAPGRLILDDGRTVDGDSVIYAPPVQPATIICVHLNYRSRAVEFRRELEGGHPTYFIKPVASLNAHRGELVRPTDCRLLNYEGEVAAVVGRPMRRVRPEDVWEHLAGFCCANDVGSHDFRDTDAGSMMRVKGQDGFCPIGPALVSGVDIRESSLRTYVNGQMVQNAPLSEMVFGIDDLFADITRHLSLEPGDVVLTGTPWHSRPMFPGDEVEVEVDGLGRLSNHVVDGPAPDNHRGFAATVTKTSLGVALGSDYRKLKRDGRPPAPEDYQRERGALIAENMDKGPPPPPAEEGSGR
ncbi:MAG: fumarylacetoacetate hydrolase family protein [Myxococcales bacterium]|nr:fumarylacetoacetate hydrolase family protein [Myxococcales bacterium]